MSDEYPTQEADSRIRIRWKAEGTREGWVEVLRPGRSASLTVNRKKALVFHSFQREFVDKLVADLGLGYEAVETEIAA